MLVLAATALAVALCGLTGTASAQSFDSLRCYKVRPQNGQWTVDLGNTMQPLTLTPFQAPPFSVEAGCRLVPQRNPRPRQVCLPASVTPSQAPSGQELSSLFACYNVKCPSSPDIDLALTTQFGTGTREVWRATRTRKICVPTEIGGPVPTATPSPAPTPTQTPIITPTEAPTVTPTPVVGPTVTPTPFVGPTPTSDPTPSPAPTAEPSPTPTAEPTATPTPVPTASPSPTPTATNTTTTTTITNITTTTGGGECNLTCQNGGTVDEESCTCSCFPNISGPNCQFYDCSAGHVDQFFCASLPLPQGCENPYNAGRCPQTCLCGF